MAPRPLPLPLLLLLPLLLGSTARPAAPRAPRHSDGTFTSELSRLRDGARLQRLLQGLVGKRSEQGTENSTAWVKPTEGQLCLLWSAEPALRAWVPPGAPLHLAWSPWLPPASRPGVKGPEAAEASRRPK